MCLAKVKEGLFIKLKIGRCTTEKTSLNLRGWFKAKSFIFCVFVRITNCENKEGGRWEMVILIAPTSTSPPNPLKRGMRHKLGAQKVIREGTKFWSRVENRGTSFYWPPGFQLIPKIQGSPKTPPALWERWTEARDTFQGQKQCTCPLDNLLHPLSLLCSR